MVSLSFSDNCQTTAMGIMLHTDKEKSGEKAFEVLKDLPRKIREVYFDHEP